MFCLLSRVYLLCFLPLCSHMSRNRIVVLLLSHASLQIWCWLFWLAPSTQSIKNIMDSSKLTWWQNHEVGAPFYAVVDSARPTQSCDERERSTNARALSIGPFNMLLFAKLSICVPWDSGLKAKRVLSPFKQNLVWSSHALENLQFQSSFQQNMHIHYFFWYTYGFFFSLFSVFFLILTVKGGNALWAVCTPEVHSADLLPQPSKGLSHDFHFR